MRSVGNLLIANPQVKLHYPLALILALSRKLTYINDGVKKGKFLSFEIKREKSVIL